MQGKENVEEDLCRERKIQGKKIQGKEDRKEYVGRGMCKGKNAGKRR